MPPPDELLPHALAFLRIFAFLAAFPALRQQLGAGVVVSAAIALTAAASPLLAHGTSGKLPGAESLLGVAALELLAGLALGVPFAVLASVLFSSGRLLDLFRGNMLAEQLVPGFEERASPLEAGAALGLTALVFASGLWCIPLTVLYRSFETESAALVNGLVSLEGVTQVFAFAQLSLRESCFLLAPALLVMAAFELGVCALGKAVPRIHIGAEVAGLRLVLGLLALAFVDWGGAVPAGLWQSVPRPGG